MSSPGHSNSERALSIRDDLGHELLVPTQDVRRQLIDWLNLEDSAGESSEGLRELRDILLAEDES